MTYIVVHPGAAHRDDFLSCCLLLAHDSSIRFIERCEPTNEEMSDRNCIVVDVGNEIHIPCRNYDHHQFEKDHRPYCALSAVIRFELNMEEEFRNFDWFEFTEQMDSKGPFETAKLQGWEAFPFASQSPIEAALLRMFGRTESVVCGDMLFYTMRSIGVEIFSNTRKYVAGLAKAAKDTTPYHVSKCPAMGLWCDDVDSLPYLNALRNKQYKGHMFSVCPDDRGDGLTLYRFDDYKHLDFSKLEGHPDVSFAHKGGFIAKTKKVMSEVEVAELISLACTPLF